MEKMIVKRTFIFEGVTVVPGDRIEVKTAYDIDAFQLRGLVHAKGYELKSKARSKADVRD